MDLRKKQRVVLEALEDIKGRDIVVFTPRACHRCSSAW